MAEEFLLLCINGQTGKKIISSAKIEPALGAALLVELALKERISVTRPPPAGGNVARKAYSESITPAARAGSA